MRPQPGILYWADEIGISFLFYVPYDRYTKIEYMEDGRCERCCYRIEAFLAEELTIIP